MDNMRGQFSDQSEPFGDAIDHEFEDETVGDLPPDAIGQDERRMQVRAYNFWAGMLEDRNFPAIEDLEPEDVDDFGPHSVLLDFTSGIDDPAIAYLGDKLAGECGTDGPIERLSDVPSRSLLSRITDHYLQIIANQAPIGFEAEFVNQRGLTILYRGILLPYSSDDDTIDFIYGVINWKEMADQQTTDELMLQIDQALEPMNESVREEAPHTDWADGPANTPDILDLGAEQSEAIEQQAFPEPEFGQSDDDTSDDGTAHDDILDDGADDSVSNHEASDRTASLLDISPASQFSDLPVAPEAELETEMEPGATTDAAIGLADWLASARALADEAKVSEDRTRKALYAAIGRAYDFSIAATQAPDEFGQLVEDAGLVIQDRAPMTPIVKLVFGADYDKTRLTEYAAALTHAHRHDVKSGELAELLGEAPGGLKGIVAEERRLRREESGKPSADRDTVRETLARKLRKLESRALADLPVEGGEFTVLVARRLPDGQVVLLGEIADDLPLIERAAKRLLK